MFKIIIVAVASWLGPEPEGHESEPSSDNLSDDLELELGAAQEDGGPLPLALVDMHVGKVSSSFILFLSNLATLLDSSTGNDSATCSITHQGLIVRVRQYFRGRFGVGLQCVYTISVP